MLGKLELYRIFCQVAKDSSFSQAAKNLYLSQPAVSQSVKQLEEQLGVQLFTRGAKGVSLTQQGKLLYEYADSAMGLLSSAEQKLVSMKELTVCYLSEAREGQTLDLYWDYTEEGALQVEAKRKLGEKDERVFAAKILY